MAYDSLQNARACITRAIAEIAQAGRECDESENADMGDKLRKAIPAFHKVRDEMDKRGALGGGEPRARKPAASEAGEAAGDLSPE